MKPVALSSANKKKNKDQHKDVNMINSMTYFILAPYCIWLV